MKSRNNSRPARGRRTFLKGAAAGAAAGAACLALPPLTATASPAIERLNSRLALLTLGGANVLAFDSGQGTVLVDSGPAAEQEALDAGLRELGGERVSVLFNTHWHADQCGGNTLLGERGARIVAHEKSRLRLSTTYYLPHEERYHEPLSEAGRPGESFFTGDSMPAGDEMVDYGYLRQAHTDGDIFVRFREANVLAVGDVISPLLDPSHDWYGGGWIGGRLDAMDRLLELADDETRIVPAYGPVVGREELEAEREMMSVLFDKMVDLIREGYSARDMLEEGIMDNLERQFEDPYRFLYDAYKGLWAHHNKLAPNIV